MKAYTTRRPLAVGNKVIPIGGVIELSDADARPLLANGVIVAKAAPKTQDKAAPKASNKSK